MKEFSLGAMLRESCAKWGERTAMLSPEGSGFEPLSYARLGETVRAYAGVLRDLGLAKGDRLAILSENCMEWALADWACQTLGVIVVPIYPTLPADQAGYIIGDSGAKVVVAGSDEQARKVEQIPGVAVVMLRDGIDSLKTRSATAQFSESDWNAAIDAVDPGDLATIIYTSGTTGPPKGAMLPHRAFTFLCHSARANLPLDERDTFLTFLPMAHVFERFAGQAFPISFGGTIAYAKNLASLASDIQKVRPTVLLCVPRFLEATMDKIMEGARKQGGLSAKLFHLAHAQGVRKVQGKFAPLAGLLNAVVGKKIREKLGGRIRFFVSGGAALPKHVAEFYQAFGFTILQGYGLTETCAATCVNHPDRNRYWTVGEPIPGMEVKIAEDGEILIRGPGVMTGYYHQPEATSQAIDAEGWFHTGDVGEFEGQNLKITDRKKDILVLGNGKNVAPQPIENRLKASPFIQEAVVLGDGMDHCIALIVPNFEAVRAEIGVAEIGVAESEDLTQNPAARALIKKEVDAVNKTLANFELVKKHALVPKAFSVDEGEMTPTMKVKRKVIKEKYASLISELR